MQASKDCCCCGFSHLTKLEPRQTWPCVTLRPAPLPPGAIAYHCKYLTCLVVALYNFNLLRALFITVHPGKNAPIRKIGTSYAACSVTKNLHKIDGVTCVTRLLSAYGSSSVYLCRKVAEKNCGEICLLFFPLHLTSNILFQLKSGTTRLGVFPFFKRL